jgi:hypothetical protein
MTVRGTLAGAMPDSDRNWRSEGSVHPGRRTGLHRPPAWGPGDCGGNGQDCR